MNSFKILLGIFIVSLIWNCKKEASHSIPVEKLNEKGDETELKSGDIIFQTSLSDQSKAIKKATYSSYTHCGLILKKDEKFWVLEAVQPVKFTPLDVWINNGENGHFVVKRLKEFDAYLNPTVLAEMQNRGQEFLGKNYDLTFEWSDDKIYCSELIWKIYHRTTGLEVGKLQKLKDFNLKDEEVKQKLSERYGQAIPLEETVISPQSIFESELLETIISKN
jgi:hypothetical protein